MKNYISNISQEKAVTLARILYPIWMLVGMFSLVYVPSKLYVSGDASTTASNILTHEFLFRLGIVGSLLEPIIFVIASLLLYKLFVLVDKNYATLMVLLVSLSVPITMLSTLGNIGALLVLNGAGYMDVFDIAQQHALMLFFLDMNAQGILIATIFWGLWLFPLGHLVYKSGYFPKSIGVFVTVAGFGFLLSPFTHLLVPNSKETILPILDILTMGEMVFILWLLFKGAKIPKTPTGVDPRCS